MSVAPRPLVALSLARALYLVAGNRLGGTPSWNAGGSALVPDLLVEDGVVYVDHLHLDEVLVAFVLSDCGPPPCDGVHFVAEVLHLLGGSCCR